MGKKINWGRIVSIAGLTFCTTILATGVNVEGALINAILLTGIALFTEMKFETEGLTKIQRVVNKGLIL